MVPSLGRRHDRALEPARPCAGKVAFEPGEVRLEVDACAAVVMGRGLRQEAPYVGEFGRQPGDLAPLTLALAAQRRLSTAGPSANDSGSAPRATASAMRCTPSALMWRTSGVAASWRRMTSGST